MPICAVEKLVTDEKSVRPQRELSGELLTRVLSILPPINGVVQLQILFGHHRIREL